MKFLRLKTDFIMNVRDDTQSDFFSIFFNFETHYY